MTTPTATTYSAADLAAMAGSPDSAASEPPAALDPRLCDRTSEDVELQERQRAAWDAYEGKFKNSVSVDPQRRNRNVKANRCAAIVDKTAAWLSKGLQIEVADKGAPAGKKPAKGGKPGKSKADAPKDPRQAALEDILGDQDRFKAFLTMVYMTGSVTGHAFVKIAFDELRYRQRGELPTFTVLDSRNVHVLTHPDDCNVALAYVIEYATPLRLLNSGGAQQSIIKRQIIARVRSDGVPRYGPTDTSGQMPEGAGEIADDDEWTIATYTRVAPAGQSGLVLPAAATGAGAWHLLGAVIRWPYAFPPIADCMNLPAPTQYYGLPDLVPELIHLNQRINDVQSDTATVLEAYSLPMPWASGLDPSQSVIRPEPGTLVPLPDNSTAGVLQPRGDIASNRDFTNDLRADMDERSRVPAVALGRQESLPKGNISGVALELMFQPLIEKVTLQRVLYGPMISCLCLWALVLVGMATLDDTEIRLQWADLLPNDDAATAQMITAMKGVGTSDHAIDRVLKIDYDEEQEYKQQEAQDQMTAMTQGLALPVPPPPPPDDGSAPPQAQAQPPADGSQPPAQPSGNGGNMPPTNHPAAIAQRARVAATAKL